MRLRRSDPDKPGWTRRRAGRGFVYLDADGARLPDDDIDRIKELVIPPAWRDVWICPFPNGHIQALGTDDAGRRQYLYHPQWRARQDKLKHDHVLDVGRRLPTARERVRTDLQRAGLPRERVLALAFALLDVAYLRIGNESYARDNGSYGLSTLRRKHAKVVD
ncbi:MAG: DNA topoisomerase IB, partial [Actinomycetota bacterium]|nr:DNA topoisomerase IB [Actinomycetota bacterium]